MSNIYANFVAAFVNKKKYGAFDYMLYFYREGCNNHLKTDRWYWKPDRWQGISR